MALPNIMNHQTDDILRIKARSTDKIDNGALTLIRDMAETMYNANGAAAFTFHLLIYEMSFDFKIVDRFA